MSEKILKADNQKKIGKRDKKIPGREKNQSLINIL